MWETLGASAHDDHRFSSGRLAWTWPALFGVVAGILWGVALAGPQVSGPQESGLWAVLCLALGLLLCAYHRQPWLVLLLLLGALTGHAAQQQVAKQPDHMAPWIGAQVTLKGSWDGQFLTLQDPRARVALAPRPKVPAGQLVVSGRLIRPDGRRIPHGFHQAAWLSTQGGLLLPTPKSVLVGAMVRQHTPVGGLRGWFEQGLTAGLPQQQAALMRAIGTGDRSELDNEQLGHTSVRDAFSASGLAHLMALSGQNVALITGCLIWLLGLLGTTPWLRYGLPALLLLPYLLVLVNLSPSITRAVIMGMAVLLALMIGRGRPALLDILAFAALVCLLLFPLWLFDIGFQLSFLAVLALNYSGPLAERLPRQWPQWLRLALVVPVLAQVGTLPIIAHSFGQLPWLSTLPANILAAPLMALLVPLGFLAGLLGPAAVLINWLTSWLATALLWLAQVFGQWPLLSWGAISTAGFVAYGVFALALVWWLTGKIRAKVLMAATLFLMLASFLPSLRPASEVVFVDVGQGDATLLRLGQTNILIDGGGTPRSDYDVGARTVLPALRAIGVRKLDIVVATHADTDHIEGLLSVLRLLPVGELWIGHNKPDDLLLAQLLGVAEERGVPVREVRRGDQVKVGQAQLTVLWPRGQVWSTADNDNSVALHLATPNERMAFLGDLPSITEEALGLGPLTVLKAAHHGSRHSTGAALLAQTRPQHVVISVGRNVYGHPSPQVLERIAAVGATTWRTDTQGTVRWPLR